MKQITEDYVSYETAVLLKEKGFEDKCDYIYKNKLLQFDDTTYYYGGVKLIDRRDNEEIIPAPSQSLALKWLREVHNLHITIKPYITEDGNMYLFEIYKLEAEKFTLIKTKTGFEKSELANEAALKYTLENLI